MLDALSLCELLGVCLLLLLAGFDVLTVAVQHGVEQLAMIASCPRPCALWLGGKRLLAHMAPTSKGVTQAGAVPCPGALRGAYMRKDARGRPTLFCLKAASWESATTVRVGPQCVEAVRPSAWWGWMSCTLHLNGSSYTSAEVARVRWFGVPVPSKALTARLTNEPDAIVLEYSWFGGPPIQNRWSQMAGPLEGSPRCGASLTGVQYMLSKLVAMVLGLITSPLLLVLLLPDCMRHCFGIQTEEEKAEIFYGTAVRTYSLEPVGPRASSVGGGGDTARL